MVFAKRLVEALVSQRTIHLLRQGLMHRRIQCSRVRWPPVPCSATVMMRQCVGGCRSRSVLSVAPRPRELVSTAFGCIVRHREGRGVLSRQAFQCTHAVACLEVILGLFSGFSFGSVVLVVQPVYVHAFQGAGRCSSGYRRKFIPEFLSACPKGRCLAVVSLGRLGLLPCLQ